MTQDESRNDSEDITQPTPEVRTERADTPTIGTGTSLALGCVAGTILLIVIGLIYILIAALV